ncbi:MAG: hypothetical protein Q9M18_07625 [Mariprofundaceae bacterium]|nr:hypothetical protein [Mariprofundaceae bacterium]
MWNPIILLETDVILEILRAMMAVTVVGLMLRQWRNIKPLRDIAGSGYILAGFILLAFASLIDITDNFTSLNYLIIVGDTPFESFLEKVVGYLGGFLCIAIGLKKWLPSMLEYQAHIQNQLNQATDDIKQLESLLPICATCKKIRNKEGAWSEVEVYIRDHSETNFSHGICPSCVEDMKHEMANH